jgi:16S rRNA (cytidine1402-2'-O)-methyltransferase
MSVLYVVPTPIGNLGDISARALEVLNSVDFIVAEDTRVSIKLLTHFGIKKPLLSYHEHNKSFRGAEIVSKILGGESCAIVTDAGTPAISDPGTELAHDCFAAGIRVIPLPGPCAAICALSAAGVPAGRFCFEGFLSVSKKSRREHLEMLKNERRVMVFYEAPHKLKKTLKDMLDAFGDRELTLARELTKVHEEIIKTTLSGAIALYENIEPRGEYVLIVSPPPKKDDQPSREFDLSGSSKDAAQRAKESGLSRNQAYRASLAAKKKTS